MKFFQNFDLEVAPNQQVGAHLFSLWGRQVEGYSLLKPGSLTPPFLSFDTPGASSLGLCFS